MTIPILTIYLTDVPVPTRHAFLKFIKQYVYTFALKRKQLFAEALCNAEHFHKDKQNINKTPLLIHNVLLENKLALRAYTQVGINTLTFWYKLFSKAHPEFCKNVILKNETYKMQSSKVIHSYYSNNWIPYRKCTFKNGFYYNEAKNEVANFNDTLIGNLRTFLNILGFDGALRFNLRIKTLQKHKPTVALLEKNNDIVKHSFSVVMETNLELPALFSVGQNVGYGNGLFLKNR